MNQPAPPEMIVPKGATPKAIQQCAHAMHYLLEIGWPLRMLPELERLWWMVHDEEGKVK